MRFNFFATLFFTLAASVAQAELSSEGLGTFAMEWGGHTLPGELLSALPSDLTVLSESQAQIAYGEIAANLEIPFAYPDECYAKAQKIAMLLDDKGIVSAKAFMEGNIFKNEPGWGDQLWLFHVAPVVLVESARGIVLYAIDPYLAKKLVTYEEWAALVRKDRRTKIKKEYFTNRFVYDPTQVALNPSDYNPKLVTDMEIVFRRAWKRLKNRERGGL